MDDQSANVPPRALPPIPDARTRAQHIPGAIQRRARMRPRRAEHSQTDSNSVAPLNYFRGIMPGVNPAHSHLQRHRMRRQRENEGFGTVQETVDDLDNDQQTTTRMNTSALDQTLPIPAGVDEFTGLQDNMDAVGRRNKRRKIGTDLHDAGPKISYGYHGQVAPARLQMQLSYCDGGNLEGRLCVQQNLLRNDKSVYCSRKSKVNLMLSHPGSIPFTCTKIVIKTPDSGFVAPVQEGMVFVFMDEHNVLEDTSQFHLQDWCTAAHPGATPPPERARLRTRLRMSNGEWQLDDSDRERPLTPMGDYDAALVPFGRNPYSVALPQSHRPETSYSHDGFSPLTRISNRNALPCGVSAYENNILISCDQLSSDDEDITSEAVLEDRRRRARQTETDNSEIDEDGLEFTYSNQTVRQRPFSRAIIWEGKDPTSSSSSSSGPKPPGRDVPYVRFFIERKKHVVSIKFNPPVSGRHVLVKLWSPHGRTSLDLQSVCVYGYAGPRFFPALHKQ